MKHLAQVVLEIQTVEPPRNIFNVQRRHLLAGHGPHGVLPEDHPEYPEVVIERRVPPTFIVVHHGTVHWRLLVTPRLEPQPSPFALGHLLHSLEGRRPRIQLRTAVEHLHVIDRPTPPVNIRKLLLVHVHREVVEEHHPRRQTICGGRGLHAVPPQRHRVETHVHLPPRVGTPAVLAGPARVVAGAAADDGPVRARAEQLELAHGVVVRDPARRLFAEREPRGNLHVPVLGGEEDLRQPVPHQVPVPAGVVQPRIPGLRDGDAEEIRHVVGHQVQMGIGQVGEDRIGQAVHLPVRRPGRRAVVVALIPSRQARRDVGKPHDGLPELTRRQAPR
mmetsp:Transcript_4126/g.8596  ORF Transcript_4126/g.8596 Transcript_4126/m.8596 type:complete len:333 (+) Transcript_4126:263-1261(+)